jgi:hypothetical protein
MCDVSHEFESQRFHMFLGGSISRNFSLLFQHHTTTKLKLKHINNNSYKHFTPHMWNTCQ